MKTLMEKYRNWVSTEGHMMASAESVLDEYIEKNNLGNKEYEQLATEMHWTEVTQHKNYDKKHLKLGQQRRRM